MQKFILLFCTIITLNLNLYNVGLSQTDVEKNVIKKYVVMELTTENVARAIKELDIKYPVHVFSQTIKESGWTADKKKYKSMLATKGNNLFGMRRPGKRRTYAMSTIYLGYAKFEHWIYSVLDYKIWQESVPLSNTETYENYLRRRKYARDTESYVKTLLSYKLPENIYNILGK